MQYIACVETRKLLFLTLYKRFNEKFVSKSSDKDTRNTSARITAQQRTFSSIRFSVLAFSRIRLTKNRLSLLFFIY